MAVVVGSLAIDEPTAPATDKLADTVTHTTGEGTVEREVVCLGDPDNTRTANRVACLTTAPSGGDVGLVVRNLPSGTQLVDGSGATQPVSGTVTVTATALDVRALTSSDVVTAQARAQFDDVAPTLPGENAFADLRITGERALWANLRDDSTGAEIGVTGNPLVVDGSAVTQPVSGTVTANAGTSPASTAGWRVQLEDSGTGDRAAVTVNGDLKVTLDGEDVTFAPSHTRNESFGESAAMGAEMDETTPVVATEGGVSPLRIDAQRSLYVQLRSGSAEVGTGAAPLRVDPTGSTTQPVSGTVTADAGTGPWPVTDNGGNLSIDIGGTVPSLNTGVRDAGTQRVTVATNDLVPISAASLPLPAGAATAANQLADGHNVTVDNLVSAPAFVRQSDGASAIDPRDINDFVGRTIRSADINDGGSGDNTIVALVSGRRIKVFAINLSSTGTVNAKWKSGAATDLTGDNNLQAREGYTIAVTPPAFLFGTAAGEALVLNLSGAVACDGWVSYWDDDTT